MPKGAIHINEAAQPYQHAFPFSPAHSDTRTGISAAVPGDCGIQWGPSLSNRLFIEFGAGITLIGDNYSVSVTTPWGSWTLSGAVFVGLTIRLEWDDLVLTVLPNCDWSLSFSELRIYVTIGGGAETLWQTVPADGDSGIDFDLRKDVVFGQGILASISPAFPSGGDAPDCSLTFAGQEVFDSVTSGSIKLQYRYGGTHGGGGWSEDTISIKDIGQNDLPCDCDQPLPDLVGGLSWTDGITVTGLLEYHQTKTALAEQECICPRGGSIIQYPFLVTFTGRQDSTLVRITPNTSELYPVVTTQFARCGPPPEGTTQDTDETTGVEPGPITYSEQDLELIDYFVHEKYCAEAGISTCVLNPGEEPPDCPLPPDTFCGYGALSSYFWTHAPPCVDGEALWPWNHPTVDGRFFRTDVVDGEVYVYASSFHIPGFDTQTEVTTTGDCIRPTIAEDMRRRLHLTYTRIDGSDNPTVFRRWSDDDAETFSAEEALGIADGKYAAVFTNPDGDVLYAAFVYDSGTTGPGQIYYRYWGAGVQWADVPAASPIEDASGPITFADDTFAFCFAHHGSGALMLHATEDGDSETSLWTSWDDCETFGDKRTGITSGSFPTVAESPDGGIIASAYVAGKIKVRYQGPGDTALAAAVTVQDDAAADIEIEETTFHITQARHGAAGWVLSCILLGETATSEHICWDEDSWDFRRLS